MAKKAKKKKAAKKKTSPKKKKKTMKKKAAPAGPGPRTADLNSIRAAIDRVRAHIRAAPPAPPAPAGAAAAPDRSAQLLAALDQAYVTMQGECCNSDQNCNF